MKILHVISQAPDFTGSGKTIQAIMACATSRGHGNALVAGIQEDPYLDPVLVRPEHTFYVRFGTRERPYPLPGMSDVMPYRSTRFSEMTQAQIAGYESAFEDAVQRAVHAFKPDLIHAHHLWLVTCATRRVAPSVPMVVSCHGTCLRQSVLCPHINDKISKNIKYIDNIFALGADQKQTIETLHHVQKNKVTVVGAGFNDALFHCREKPSDGVVEMVYAGKLSQAKGVPWLLRSLKKVSAENWRLHLAGGGAGPEKKLCLDLAAEFGSRVKIHGPLPHQDLAELMRRCHLFVLPSFYEGLPLVLMEAIASGCRVITTSLPGTREILGEAPDSLVTLIDLPELQSIDAPYASDVPALENRLASALESSIAAAFECPEPDFEETARISGRYTWDQVFSIMEKVYAEVAGQQGNVP